MESKVTITGVNTSQLPLYSNEEMMNLFQQYHGEKKQEAREQLIQGNLRLVLTIVQRYRHHQQSLDDLFQVGCIGLVKAVDHFDRTRGVHFSTYAFPMIVGEIKRYNRDNQSIRISRAVKNLAYKSIQIREQLLHELGQEPTIEQLAERMEVEKEELVWAMESVQDSVSLYTPLHENGEHTLYIFDQLDDPHIGEWTEHLALKESMKKLTPREQWILSMRYFMDKTQAEIAEELGISQAQISRIEKSALSKMNQDMQHVS